MSGTFGVGIQRDIIISIGHGKWPLIANGRYGQYRAFWIDIQI